MAQCPNKVQYQCITDIQLSRVLHVVSEYAYAYLNQPHIWMNLMRFYDGRNLISDRDIRIIDDASKFRRGSPSKELLLRVATNSKQQLTLRDLLTDLYNLDLNEASQVIMEDLARTHQSLQLNGGFNNSIVNHSIPSNFVDDRRRQKTNVYGTTNIQVQQQRQDDQLSSLRSLNNLSHPDKPYLYILRHPASKSVNEGESVILSCYAESDPASIHYQWYKNNEELVSECQKILILENVRRSDVGDYRCEVYCKEFALHETSRTAVVRVILESPQILVQPSSHAAPLGSRISLACEAVGSPVLSHQWYKNDHPVANQTRNTMKINKLSADHCGEYYCKVSNNQGYVFSEHVAITICSTGYDSKSSFLDSEYSVHYATDKVALLMANEDYTHNPKLAAAANDVQALSHTMNELNFKTISLVNLNLDEMKQAVKLFCSHLINGAYCLIYIAGHGFENDGQCYIVPVDAPKNYKSADCFSVRKLIKNIQRACNLSLTVILLDVCRKRNENIIALPEPHNGQAYQGNFVISFAAMESGMAYEIKGQKLSIYVTSLRKHLGKNKKITRILELVQMDIYNGFSTKGVQQPIFKSNIYEDRKLTDPVIPRNKVKLEVIRNDVRWKESHESMKPWLIYFESCGLEVVLHTSRNFSNSLTMTASILNEGNSTLPEVSLFVDPEQIPHFVDCTVDTNQVGCCIIIKHLQRINIQALPITLRVKYLVGMDVFECFHNDHINLRFVDWWTSVQ